MQMNSAVGGGVVDEAYDGLASLLDQESRARRDPIVTNENCVALVWVDLLGELVDVYLVVIDLVVGDWVCNGPMTCQRAFGVEKIVGCGRRLTWPVS